MQLFARFRTNLGNRRISQDICYVRLTDNNYFLTIYGHCANFLNNKAKRIPSLSSQSDRAQFLQRTAYFMTDRQKSHDTQGLRSAQSDK